MAAHPLTLQAIARRNRSSAANFAETIVRPRSGSAPSTIASRRSSVSESQTRTLAAPITRIEYVMKNSLCGQENRSSKHGVERRQLQQLSKMLDRIGAHGAALLQNHDARADLLDHLEDV